MLTVQMCSKVIFLDFKHLNHLNVILLLFVMVIMVILNSGRRETLILSLANRFGPDPPFRVVTDCKAKVRFVCCFRVAAPAVRIEGR